MTAVEWLIEQIEQYTLTFGPIPSYKLNHLKQQAKEMEKEQIIGTYVHLKMKNNKLSYGMKYIMKLQKIEDDAERYYNETFKKKNT